MEFPGLGIIPFEAPSEELRPFVRKKFRNFFRGIIGYKDGVVHASLLNGQCKKISQEFPDRQKEVEEKLIAAWDFLAAFDDSPSITEEDFLDKWMKRIYATGEAKKKIVKIHRDHLAYYFTTVDTNSDGVIDFQEFKNRSTYVTDESLNTIFHLFDVNKDGYLQRNEFLYSTLMFSYNSGPGDRFAYMFGPIPDEYE